MKLKAFFTIFKGIFIEVNKKILWKGKSPTLGQCKKLVVYFGLYNSFLVFQGGEDQINTVCKK